MEYLEEAKRKLADGQKADCGKYGNVMKKDVAAALENFCEQDGEFAQAVAQGGSFKECMDAVSKAVHGNGISDMEAYGAAVKFFFPGAGITVQMKIDLCAEVGGAVPEKSAGSVVIDISDFF